MRLNRCFVPGPIAAGTELDLPPGPAAHLSRVLRLRVGAQLRLFDGSGGEFEATLIEQDRRGRTRVRVGARQPIERESPLAITLLQCLVRAERMDWIVQKSTELGVTELLPVSSRHGVVQLDDRAADRRQQHWAAIAAGACEQCGRNRLPRLHPVQPLESACRYVTAARTTRLLLDPDADRSLAQAVLGQPDAGAPAAVALLVGPEGGLAQHELDLALQCGFLPCRLGPRVLRAETAPLAALSCLQSLLGDLA